MCRLTLQQKNVFWAGLQCISWDKAQSDCHLHHAKIWQEIPISHTLVPASGHLPIHWRCQACHRGHILGDGKAWSCELLSCGHPANGSCGVVCWKPTHQFHSAWFGHAGTNSSIRSGDMVWAIRVLLHAEDGLGPQLRRCLLKSCIPPCISLYIYMRLSLLLWFQKILGDKRESSLQCTRFPFKTAFKKQMKASYIYI